MTIHIRPETPADVPAIFHIHQRAFGRDNEARLVNKLRGENAIVLSLVAQVDEAIVGHILFSPVTIRDDNTEWQALGLGHPEYYPRFGFQPVQLFGIRWEVDVLAEVFMLAELAPGARCANLHYDYRRRLGQLAGVQVQPVHNGSQASILACQQRGQKLGDIKVAVLPKATSWGQWFIPAD